MTHSADRLGFTLIELLVVLSTIVLLTSMVMPMIALAQRAAKKTNTENILRKVDVAAQLFKVDVGALPYGAAPAVDTGPWTNDLAFRLMHEPTAAESSLLRTHLQVVAAAYATGGTQAFPKNATVIDQPRDVFSLRGRKIWDDDGDGTYDTTYPREDATLSGVISALNRMARERASIAVMSGCAAVLGVQQNAGDPWTPGTEVLSSVPAASRTRGFTGDYLHGQLEERQYSSVGGVPEAIKDAYGRELVHVRPCTNGVHGYVSQYCTGQIDAGWFGLAAQSRTTTLSLASDIRTHAGIAFVQDGETWSAGRDGRFAPMRDDVSNADNISSTRYLRGLR